MKEKSVTRIIISSLVALCIFIIVLVLVNIYPFSNGPTFHSLIDFLNRNLGLIIMITLILMVADVLYTFPTRISLPAPIFSAIGAVLIFGFLFRVLELIDLLINITIFSNLSWLKGIIYSIVFIVVLISGYVSIWTGEFAIEREKPREEMINITPRSKKSWKDVGDEFKGLVSDSITNLRTKVNKTKNKPKKR